MLLDLLSDSIDFVQQIHWFCSTISMDLFRQTAAFDVAIRHFHRLFLAVFICELGQDRPLFSHGRTRTDTDSYSTNNKRTNTDWHLYLEILYITNLRIT